MTNKKVNVSFTCVICGSVVEVEQEHEGVKCGGCKTYYSKDEIDVFSRNDYTEFNPFYC